MEDKVLVVEDERHTLDIIVTNLEEAGYRVIGTPRGDRAIQIALREKPDLVVLDIILEGPLDGYSVARSLNVLDEANSPYIIFLSTKREVRDRIQGFATGAHDFISKEDFSAEEFLARVDNGIRIKKTHDALRDRSNIDGLTNLFNHRFFMEELSKEMEKADRIGLPLSLAFLDVDDFKLFNDRFGHYSGDRVLTKIASIMKSRCRNTDICARYGGEEFVVLFPQTDVHGTQIVMERIRKTIEQERFPVRGSGVTMQFESITVSIGISAYMKGSTAQEFIELSDKKALYRAKSAGKNRIYLFLGFDQNGTELVIDAAGRQPDKIDLSDLAAKMSETEAKIIALGDESLLKIALQARKNIEKLSSKLKEYYKKKRQRNATPQE